MTNFNSYTFDELVARYNEVQQELDNAYAEDEISALFSMSADLTAAMQERDFDRWESLFYVDPEDELANDYAASLLPDLFDDEFFREEESHPQWECSEPILCTVTAYLSNPSWTADDYYLREVTVQVWAHSDLEAADKARALIKEQTSHPDMFISIQMITEAQFFPDRMTAAAAGMVNDRLPF